MGRTKCMNYALKTSIKLKLIRSHHHILHLCGKRSYEHVSQFWWKVVLSPELFLSTIIRWKLWSMYKESKEFLYYSCGAPDAKTAGFLVSGIWKIVVTRRHRKSHWGIRKFNDNGTFLLHEWHDLNSYSL